MATGVWIFCRLPSWSSSTLTMRRACGDRASRSLMWDRVRRIRKADQVVVVEQLVAGVGDLSRRLV